MKFYKYTGLGNDFILLDNTKGDINMNSALAINMCDRHFGIGADGVVLVSLSSLCDIKMEIFNSDGSIAEMCGNASRCFAKFCYEKNIVSTDTFTIETLAGVVKPKLNIENNIVKEITVDLGSPLFASKDIPFSIDLDQVVDYPISVDGKDYSVTAMFMGVPHVVIFTNNISDEKVIQEGRKIEVSKYFPKKINVNFVSVLNRNEIDLRTWERSAGYTLACGTGSCASVIAGILNKKLNDKVLVHLRGGDLKVEWEKDHNVKMTGMAKEVFTGEYSV
ncbi:MAG TPA: diaminopimelate epimerase [Clostridia bacterium]|nr:diaminopimelate epimerase [Clostridia bacterium]